MKHGALTPGDFASEDRRQQERQRHLKSIAVMPFSPGQGLEFRPARLTDCSTSGIGLLIDRPLKLGDQFMVKATLKQFALIVYTVRHCRPADDGYHIGGAFAGIIGAAVDREPADVLQALIAA